MSGSDEAVTEGASACPAHAGQIGDAIAAIVAEEGYPCLGAKSVFNRGRARIVVLEKLGEPEAADRLYQELSRFSADHPREQDGAGPVPRFASFVAVFKAPIPESEVVFEELLWRQLVQLHQRDDVEWDASVRPEPQNPHFGFSVAGRAFFVIGMHAAASRLARRTPLPVLVFNLHSQFEQLRLAGRYNRLRDITRRRDLELQGQLNPMAADHGSRSEARQYSGRAVPDDWTPPYDFRHPTAKDASESP